MISTIKKSLYTVAGLAFSAQYALAGNTTGGAGGTFGVGSKDTTLAGALNQDTDLVTTLQKYITSAMTWLSVIAIAMALWGGFQILTAAGADDKVKKGKTILIQAATGLGVIWLAGTFVKWIIGFLG